MIQKELIAPCGMNCAVCIGYFGYAMSGTKRKMKCPGCNQSNKNCSFIKKYCKKLSKNEIQFCYECDDFPCTYLKKLDDKYREKYKMSMIENLKEIKDYGLEKFLKKQSEKYRCPNCGELLCIHTNKCYKCNYSI